MNENLNEWMMHHSYVWFMLLALSGVVALAVTWVLARRRAGSETSDEAAAA